MSKLDSVPRTPGKKGPDLIALAQQLARESERHAILSASLASQADRLMMAGLEQLERKTAKGKLD